MCVSNAWYKTNWETRFCIHFFLFFACLLITLRLYHKANCCFSSLKLYFKATVSSRRSMSLDIKQAGIWNLKKRIGIKKKIFVFFGIKKNLKRKKNHQKWRKFCKDIKSLEKIFTYLSIFLFLQNSLKYHIFLLL